MWMDLDTPAGCISCQLSTNQLTREWLAPCERTLNQPLYWLHLIYTTCIWSLKQFWTLNHVWNIIVNVYEWSMHKLLFLDRVVHISNKNTLSEVFPRYSLFLMLLPDFKIVLLSCQFQKGKNTSKECKKKPKHGWAYLIYSYSHLYKIDHIISVTWGLLQGRQKGYNNWMREVNSWPAR